MNHTPTIPGAVFISTVVALGAGVTSVVSGGSATEVILIYCLTGNLVFISMLMRALRAV